MLEKIIKRLNVILTSTQDEILRYFDKCINVQDETV